MKLERLIHEIIELDQNIRIDSDKLLETRDKRLEARTAYEI